MLLLLSLLAVVGMLWGSVTPAWACSCAAEAFPRQVEGAEEIVLGEVTELVVVPAASPVFPNQTGETHAIFRTEEYLKGGGPQTLDLLAYGLPVSDDPMVGFGIAGCQLFEGDDVGRRYVLFFQPDSQLDTDPSFCSGSFRIASPADEARVNEIRMLIPATLPDSGGASSGARTPCPLRRSR